MEKKRRTRIALHICLFLAVWLNASVLFAQPSPPFWWDNPMELPADRWFAVDKTGNVENDGNQAQYVRVVMDIPNSYNEQLTKNVWIQIEWETQNGPGRLLSAENTHTIKWLNSEGMCPSSPFDPYPTPDGIAYLTIVNSYTPQEEPFMDGYGVELTCESISPQPACERMEFYFEIGPGASLTYGVKVQTACFEFDFGDAPDPDYPTLLLGGAHHVIVPGLYFGNMVDADGESEGLPSSLADGDDLDNLDDEDGLVDPSQLELVKGETPSIDLNITTPNENLTVYVSGWIDLDGNGVWDESERVTVQRSGSGTVNLTFPTVASDAPAQTYARFRLSTDEESVMNPGGFAKDGEVEDYLIAIAGLDFGDAPDSPNEGLNFQTLLANDGAHHLIVSGLYLGNTSDADDESDGLPTALADGDDLDQIDDEDGLVDPAQLNFIQGDIPSIDLNVTAPAELRVYIKGWIDLDGNGTWDAGEKASAERIGSGTVTLIFPAVTIDTPNPTFARFRLSTDSSAIEYPGGFAPDGEVEDYLVSIAGLDFGDAPDSLGETSRYPTLLANNGARHVILPAFMMGAEGTIDSDADGQPAIDADGDDLDGNDDEDGVDPADLSAQVDTAPSITVKVIADPDVAFTVTGWIDYDGSGSWELAEQASASGIGSGEVMLNFPTVPANAFDLTGGQTYARFRLAMGREPVEPAGLIDNGEVEDYVFHIQPPDKFDFGDMPENLFPGFPTLNASGGAKHIIRDGVYLGFTVDSDDDGQPTDAADGDDNDGTNDDDGVTFPPLPLLQGSTVNFQVVASTEGYLNAWIDWNGDGDWDDENEHFVVEQMLNAGNNTLPVLVPVSDQTNIAAYTRFRFSTYPGLDSYTGLAKDGEVEDYLIDVVYPVELSSFSGVVIENRVKLEWVTQSETQNLGFHIFRSLVKDGDYAQISQALISGAGNSQAMHSYSYEDATVEEGQTYYYKLADISYTGQMTLHGPIEVNLAPSQYLLQQNYPNPFNPQTTISFVMKEQGQADLVIYNLRGQEVRNLASRVFGTGSHQVIWDGKDNNGNILPSGVYIYKLKSANFEQSKRMEFIK